MEIYDDMNLISAWKKQFKILKTTKILWSMKIHRNIYSLEFAFDLSKQSIILKIIVFLEIVCVSLNATFRSLVLFYLTFCKILNAIKERWKSIFFIKILEQDDLLKSFHFCKIFSYQGRSVHHRRSSTKENTIGYI